MTDSRVWQSEQCFLSITCGGENHIIGNVVMLKRNYILLSHESIRTTCFGSDVADLANFNLIPSTMLLSMRLLLQSTIK